MRAGVHTALKNIGVNERIPYNAPLIQFSSWMSGDRDGNPRVTSEVTRDVYLLARMIAANVYFSQTEDLMFELSMWHCSNELNSCKLHRSSRRDAKHFISTTLVIIIKISRIFSEHHSSIYHTIIHFI